MVEPSQREVDEALDSSMEMFQRVQVGEVAPVEPRRPERILLTLDGSSQDGTSTTLAAALAKRHSAQVTILAACDDHERVATQASSAIAGSQVTPSRGPLESFEQILEAAEKANADLIVVPCPFGRDFEQIGPDSAGTVVDVLLARAGAPLLVVREPREMSGTPFDDVVLPIIGDNAAAESAAAWAAGMVVSGGRLELLLIIAEEYHEQVRQLLGSEGTTVGSTTRALSQALQKAYIHLHRALQKAAGQLGFDYVLSVDREDVAQARLTEHNGQLALVAVPLERPDHFTEGFANHCIRSSRRPVLVVPESR